MKKKYIVLGLAIAVVLVGTVGAFAASTVRKEQSVTAKISEKDLGVTMGDSTVSEELSVNPGSDVELNYFVTNDGSSATSEDGSYDIYARVDVYYTFTKPVESSDDTEMNESAELVLNWDEQFNAEYVSFKIGDTVLHQIDSYEDQYVVGNWIVAYYDNCQLTLYYTQPIAYGENSDVFLSTMSLSTQMDNFYAGSTLTLDRTVTAVQADSATAAIAAEWGVFPEITSDGIITSVSETE